MFAENIKQGLGSVKAHATRAVITSSIIAIGIAALVGILTSISAMQIAVTKTSRGLSICDSCDKVIGDDSNQWHANDPIFSGMEQTAA